MTLNLNVFFYVPAINQPLSQTHVIGQNKLTSVIIIIHLGGNHQNTCCTRCTFYITWSSKVVFTRFLGPCIVNGQKLFKLTHIKREMGHFRQTKVSHQGGGHDLFFSFNQTITLPQYRPCILDTI